MPRREPPKLKRGGRRLRLRRERESRTLAGAAAAVVDIRSSMPRACSWGKGDWFDPLHLVLDSVGVAGRKSVPEIKQHTPRGVLSNPVVAAPAIADAEGTRILTHAHIRRQLIHPPRRRQEGTNPASQPATHKSNAAVTLRPDAGAAGAARPPRLGQRLRRPRRAPRPLPPAAAAAEVRTRMVESTAPHRHARPSFVII